MSGLWNFVKRHKKKFICAGVVVGGGYALLRYSLKKIQDIQDKEATECLTIARKQQHFDQNQKTCNKTGMLATLKESMGGLLDTDDLKSQLKSSPDRKIEIWNALKVLSVTRAVVAVYSCCHLVVSLRVQLNIIGGYMYIDSLAGLMDDKPGDQIIATPEVQQKYLENVHYLLGDGLKKLCLDIEKIVQSILINVSLKEPLTLDDLEKIIKKIRLQVEGADQDSSTLLYDYILPKNSMPQQGCLSQREWQMLHQIQNETLDVLESEMLHKVLELCLNDGFNRILDHAAEYYHPHTETHQIFDLTNQTVPMAKLIPVMNNLLDTFCDDAPTQFVQMLLHKPEVKTFSANIYESFTHVQPTKS